MFFTKVGKGNFYIRPLPLTSLRFFTLYYFPLCEHLSRVLKLGITWCLLLPMKWTLQMQSFLSVFPNTFKEINGHSIKIKF